MIVDDFRSDTVTRPSAGMRAAMAAAEVGDAVYDDDATTKRLEAMTAERLGKEAGARISSQPSRPSATPDSISASSIRSAFRRRSTLSPPSSASSAARCSAYHSVKAHNVDGAGSTRPTPRLEAPIGRISP